jgi:hypothetical protein
LAAAAIALAMPAMAHADIGHWRAPVLGEGTRPGSQRWGGSPNSGSKKRRRIEAYKQQRAANRLRRKLEARRG